MLLFLPLALVFFTPTLKFGVSHVSGLSSGNHSGAILTGFLSHYYLGYYALAVGVAVGSFGEVALRIAPRMIEPASTTATLFSKRRREAEARSLRLF
jgi:hypothetical protein